LAQKSTIILGIDPGTVIMGYGIIRVTGNHISLLDMNAIKLNGKKDMFERLGVIHDVIQALIDDFKPDHLAIEAPFFGKNVQSMLKLGRAQGIAIGVAISNKIAVTEYSPRKVKQSITGNGAAGKDQLWKMLKSMVTIDETPKYFDASDALAVAICHHFNSSTVNTEMGKIPKKSTTPKKKGSWEAFVKAHPNRVK
jgi:crossover junction endodeoxyribonuclease RuvC